MRRPILSAHDWSHSVLVVVSLFTLTASLWAQKDTGSIVGTVKDPSGAVIAGATVVVTDVERGATSNAVTSEAGEYVASPLKVGRYTVSVEHSGFKKAVSQPVSLDVQQRAVVNVTLQVGQASEQVEVTGASPLLETETSELGQVVDAKRVSTLPLNGRNFAQLALLTAGTTPSEPGARDEENFGFSAGGARSLQNNFLLDGIDNNSNLPDLLNESNYVIQPPVDALAEFKVQTNAYSAEFGRGNGAIVNAVIKSGTNQLHGSGWGFLRNNVLDARNFFDPSDKPAPPFEQYQFGGTLGGPIVIPHMYNGRNRTFFFVDYEGLRVHQAQTQALQVPTLAQRAGDFSDLLDFGNVTGTDCNGRATFGGELFDTRLTNTDPSSPTGLCGVPIGGYDAGGRPTNIIPAGKFDPLAARLTALFPAPNVVGNPALNYIANPVENTHRANFDVRIDHRFSDKDNSFYRFSYEDQPRIIPSPFQQTLADGGGFFTGIEDNSYRSVALSETHVFRPSLVNELRLGYNRVNSHRFQFNFDQDVSGIIGFPGVPFEPQNGGLPQLSFDDGSAPTLGSPTFLPSVELQNTYVLSDNLTWVRGRHTIKFGTEIRREEFTIFQPAAPRGEEFFGNGFTDNPANPGTGGWGFASFLIGLSNGGDINNLHNVDYFRPIYSFYTQDDWKLTPKLTLNLGLRYELFTTVKERNDQQGTFDLNNPTPTIIVPKGQSAQLTPTLASQIQLSPTASRGLVPVDTNNFAPRIGFAYQFTPRTVLRGGYGIFYGGQENGPYSNPSPGFNPPFFVTQSFNSPCGAASANPVLLASGNDCAVEGISNLPGQPPGSAGISVGFPATALTDPNSPTLFTINPTVVTPYMQQWNLGIERDLGGNTVLQITYAGSKGTKLFTFYNGNQADPSPDPNAAFALRRPVPAIDNSISLLASGAGSKYNSLQTRLEKRFTHGFSLLASYTWSHAIDNASNANLGSQNNDGFRWFKHPEFERGNASFDVRHRFVVSYIYELPFGRGKPFAGNASGALQQVIGGWQLAGITSISSGNWYTAQDGNGDFANSDGLQMPDQIADPNSTSPCLAGTFFNTCAFVDPPLGSFGNAPRNSVLGPGSQIWDASIFKTFDVSERTKLEFRSEFFNFPNRTNFLLSKSGPQEPNNSTVLGASQFGFLTAARPPRQIQFALKLTF